MVVEDSTLMRIKRAEKDIETARTTHHTLIDSYDKVYKLLNETREIAADNRSRLDRVEERLGRVEVRLDRIDIRLDRFELQLESVNNRLDRLEQIAAENREMIRENREMIRENQNMIRTCLTILTSIADHHGLTYELPGDTQPD